KFSLADELANERLTDIDFSVLVSLPNGIDINEWLASHTVSFFEHVNQLFSCLAESCRASCAQNSSISYQWVDEKGKKTKYNAPQFVDLLLSSIQKYVEDETIFPTKYGNKFPQTFEAIIRKVHCRLQQIINHIYQYHMKSVMQLQLTACLNTTLLHFRQFNDNFHLLTSSSTS
ncbi:hypothetical protein HELRODRAFT_124681, partial [Helobdella robusta]|uniref:Uncharacterized protein n=1 Tax=Helobdella robusta TaxID=6412 RepID=T1EH25_HELRO